jgi:hypothetical protein
LRSIYAYRLVRRWGKASIPQNPLLHACRCRDPGLRRVRAHDGTLDLVCTQERILKILKITGLTEVFGIYETLNQAIAA